MQSHHCPADMVGPPPTQLHRSYRHRPSALKKIDWSCAACGSPRAASREDSRYLSLPTEGAHARWTLQTRQGRRRCCEADATLADARLIRQAPAGTASRAPGIDRAAREATSTWAASVCGSCRCRRSRRSAVSAGRPLPGVAAARRSSCPRRLMTQPGHEDPFRCLRRYAPAGVLTGHERSCTADPAGSLRGVRTRFQHRLRHLMIFRSVRTAVEWRPRRCPIVEDAVQGWRHACAS